MTAVGVGRALDTSFLFFLYLFFSPFLPHFRLIKVEFLWGVGGLSFSKYSFFHFFGLKVTHPISIAVTLKSSPCI